MEAGLKARLAPLTLQKKAYMSNLARPLLSPVEARIVGVLSEKQRTVPDTYPMTLNALLTGCNQKTSRDPILNISESEASAAISQLKSLKLVTDVVGGRAVRYNHHLGLVLQIPSQAVALLTVLLLRGPQTAGELRLNAERLHKFSDISAVEGFLHEMAERSAGALVVELPRQPGARENRWMHLLCGEPDLEALAASSRVAGSAPESHLLSRVAVLEDEVAELKSLLQRLCNELGVALPASGAEVADE